jgi:hypothetical protein
LHTLINDIKEFPRRLEIVMKSGADHKMWWGERDKQCAISG